MPMRLLPKKEISVLQANKKRAEIDEGLKLSRRVDSLREIASNEEASLASFRSSTLKAIQSDIKKVEDERIGLLNQVKELRIELELGKSELDIRENELHIGQNILLAQETNLSDRLSTHGLMLDELKKQSKIAFSYYNQIVNTIHLIEEARKITVSKQDESDLLLQQVLKTIENVTSLETSLREELRARDIAIASKERDLIIRTEHLEIQSKTLYIKELQLIDREQTLEREFNRLKK